jgi:hypothetical protein
MIDNWTDNKNEQNMTLLNNHLSAEFLGNSVGKKLFSLFRSWSWLLLRLR